MCVCRGGVGVVVVVHELLVGKRRKEEEEEEEEEKDDERRRRSCATIFCKIFLQYFLRYSRSSETHRTGRCQTTQLNHQVSSAKNLIRT